MGVEFPCRPVEDETVDEADQPEVFDRRNELTPADDFTVFAAHA
jgi:hypothetical protein